jgi:hypothetical protein
MMKTLVEASLSTTPYDNVSQMNPCVASEQKTDHIRTLDDVRRILDT